jgi:glutaredoxin 3
MAKVEIYTTGDCSWCLAAKMLVKQKGHGYEEVRIDTDPAKFAEMLGRSQRRSVPQIFIDDEFIGGFEDLVAAVRAGKLDPPSGDAA